ncbi:MAG: alpha/beta fold hydrolase [Eggerthellaceae bacterium]|nr:alpha/beta fold hydrolase [Eggerthellaceae bacterium]MCH4221609.1 alpha/beta fold hydrolase [Eggerthellaceae bacterium]
MNSISTTRISHRTWGNPHNPIVVLLHGFMQDATAWDTVGSDIAATGRFVIAPSVVVLAHSASSLEALAADLRSRITTLLAQVGRELKSNEGISLVGYSMGGRIALAWLHAFPNDIDALVLESAGLGIASKNARSVALAKDTETVRRLDRVIQGDDTFDEFVDWWQVRPVFATQSFLADAIRLTQRQERCRWSAPDVRALVTDAGQHTMPDRDDTLDDLCTFVASGRSLLYLAGSRDRTYSEVARVLAHSLEIPVQDGECTVDHVAVMLVDAGHNIHLEHPDKFVRIVGRWLASNV